MDNNKEKKIRLEYRKSKDYRYLAATGAYGGPNPQGEIICNFYVEYQEVVDRFLYLDEKAGIIKKEEDIEDIKGEGKKLIRELQFGVVMRPDIAKVIGEWLVIESEKVISHQTEKPSED